MQITEGLILHNPSSADDTLSSGLDIMLFWNAFWNCFGGKKSGVCDSRTEQQSRAVLIFYL